MEHTYLEQRSHSILHCNRVGKCRGWDPERISPCPIDAASNGFISSTPRGLMIAARDILEAKLAYSKTLSDTLFQCTSCGNCTSLCNSIDLETGEPLTAPHKVFTAMRSDLLEAGIAPPMVGRYLRNVHDFGNAYAEPAEERDKFADDLDLDAIQVEHEYLFYVGDVGSYDPRAQIAAHSLASLLLKAGVSFGILGKQEKCDGNEVNYLGEESLFEHIARENIDLFVERGVTKIITLSPHAFNAIKRDYPEFGGHFEVVHYVQFLHQLLREGKLKPIKKLATEVTYHDPCFLGRHNNEYDAPRVVLSTVPELELIEMPRNRQNSFCCGGGSANFYTGVLDGGENRPSRLRVREAYRTGAKILATACPQCLIMFEEAIKAENLDNQLKVLDISEILLDACLS